MTIKLSMDVDLDVTLELERNLDEIAYIFKKNGNDPQKLKLIVAKFFLKGEKIRKSSRKKILDKKALIEKAVEMGWIYHKDEFRKSGENFLVHPVQAGFLTDFIGCDLTTILAAIFHDSLESNNKKKIIIMNELGSFFGDKFRFRILFLVNICTPYFYQGEKIEDIKKRIQSKLEKKAASAEKIITSSVGDRKKRAYAIKVADRATNLRTLNWIDDQASKIATLIDTQNYIYSFAEEVDKVYRPKKSMREYLEELVEENKSNLSLFF